MSYNWDSLTNLPRGTVEFIRGADGSCIRTVWAGSGPTIVLAHGYLLDLTIFNLLFQNLVDHGYRVIAFDQRGHGESREGREGCQAGAGARDYSSVFDHFSVSDGQLVAHSMGSFLSILYCLQNPDQAKKHLRRLILLGGTAGSLARYAPQNRLQIPLLKFGLIRPYWQFPPLGRAFMTKLFGSNPDEHFIEVVRTIVLRQNLHRTLPLLEAMIDVDLYPRLGQIPLETKVLCGTLDQICPRWHSELLGAELPNASNVWLENVGHMVTYEAPSAILDAIMN